MPLCRTSCWQCVVVPCLKTYVACGPQSLHQNWLRFQHQCPLAPTIQAMSTRVGVLHLTAHASQIMHRIEFLFMQHKHRLPSVETQQASEKIKHRGTRLFVLFLLATSDFRTFLPPTFVHHMTGSSTTSGSHGTSKAAFSATSLHTAAIP